ncbi:MAG TPA: tryptophan--tRNA ligase [Lentisphaeria bacterium]|nr:MAG: tryptophan--tRNA ligase [Lentisphaerae bacterium GWF2_38_69]HBM16579.1 tryptophan--tRNA ligase [Lentisphaeria bacterium]
MRILSGIQPSGTPHIGNYFGMMKQIVDDQYNGETFLFIADYHALTVTPDPNLLSQRIINLALDFLACGLDSEKVIFFKQSDIKEITELSWILSCCTPMGLLERCHSYKDKISNGIIPNCGLFFYPVLMTADILMYKSDIVPVGKDQKQHVEVARDIAIKFNLQYGETFIVPEPKIKDEVAVTPGIDGRKMSKSYGNAIPLFGDQKQIRKIFMKIVTDSKTPEDPKNPDTCNIFALYKLFANKEQTEAMAEKYKAGGLMYGNAKQELFDLYTAHFSPMQKKRDELAKNLDYVKNILRKGAEKASEVARKTIQEVREKVGLK